VGEGAPQVGGVSLVKAKVWVRNFDLMGAMLGCQVRLESRMRPKMQAWRLQ
jgi:hypothetical protein